MSNTSCHLEECKKTIEWKDSQIQFLEKMVEQLKKMDKIGEQLLESRDKRIEALEETNEKAMRLIKGLEDQIELEEKKAELVAEEKDARIEALSRQLATYREMLNIAPGA